MEAVIAQWKSFPTALPMLPHNWRVKKRQEWEEKIDIGSVHTEKENENCLRCFVIKKSLIPCSLFKYDLLFKYFSSANEGTNKKEKLLTSLYAFNLL